MSFPAPSIKTEIQEQLSNNELCGPPAQNVDRGNASLLMSAAQSLATVASGEAPPQPGMPGMPGIYQPIPAGGELSTLRLGGPAVGVQQAAEDLPNRSRAQCEMLMGARQDAEERIAQVLSASSAQLESARKLEEELASENADLQRQLADARESCSIAGTFCCGCC